MYMLYIYICILYIYVVYLSVTRKNAVCDFIDRWEPHSPSARSRPHQRIMMPRARFLKLENRGSYEKIYVYIFDSSIDTRLDADGTEHARKVSGDIRACRVRRGVGGLAEHRRGGGS